MRNESRWIAPGMVTAGVVGVLVRLWGLNAFSLWLDEILETLQTRGSFAQMWHALQQDAVHPPLEGILMWGLQHLGVSDTGRRLLPVLLGVVTFLLLAWWLGEVFGPRVGLLTAWLGALSPVHLRYSQELRPYGLALLFTVVSLVSLERYLRGGDRRWLGAFVVSVVAGLWSLYWFVLMLLPLGGLVSTHAYWGDAPSDEVGCARRLIRLSPTLALLALIAYLPWAPAFVNLLHREPYGGEAAWNWSRVGVRWQALTLAAREGDPLTWAGALFLILVLVGAVWASRHYQGLPLVVGALAGTVAVELVLAVAHHWSDARYDLLAWPFLIALAALGLDQALARRATRVVASLGLAALLIADLAALNTYQRVGRPSWQRMAEVVARLQRPGEPILVENEHVRVCLAYYLGELGSEKPKRAARDLILVDGGFEEVRRLCGQVRSCLLVLGRLPAQPRLRSFASDQPRLVDYYSTAALYRIPAWAWDQKRLSRLGQWPVPRLEPLPSDLVRQPLGWLGCLKEMVRPHRRRAGLHLDMDVSSAPALLSGWSTFEMSQARRSFVWMVGHEAALTLRLGTPCPRVITMEARPATLPAPQHQELRLLLNGHDLGEESLSPGWQSAELMAPEQLWHQGDNLLIIQARWCAPPSQVAGSGDHRPLAVAVSRIDVRSATPEP